MAPATVAKNLSLNMAEPHLDQTDSDSDGPENLDLPELQFDTRNTPLQNDSKSVAAPGSLTNARADVIQRKIVDVDTYQLSKDFIQRLNNAIIINNEPIEVKDEGAEDDPIDLMAAKESSDQTVAFKNGAERPEDTPLSSSSSRAVTTENRPESSIDQMNTDTISIQNHEETSATQTRSTTRSSIFGRGLAPRDPSPASAALDATCRSRNAQQQASNSDLELRTMVTLDAETTADINSFQLPDSHQQSPSEKETQSRKRERAWVDDRNDNATRSRIDQQSRKRPQKRRFTKDEGRSRKREKRVAEKLLLKKKQSVFSHINRRPSEGVLSSDMRATGYQQREALREERRKQTIEMNAEATSAVARQQAKETVQDRNKKRAPKNGPSTKRSSHKKHRSGYDRAEGIGELVSQISQRHANASRTDSDRLNDAQRTFPIGSVHKWSSETWKLKGMQSPLRHHQLIGSSWMIQQEKTAEHKGGILGDDPGLGKTVQSLALMIAKGAARDTNISTLVVCPANIMKQWFDEVEAHLDERRQFVIYRSSGSEGHVSEETLSSSFCVITSYSEVVKSMRAAACPNELVEEAQIMKWYETEGKRQVNVLHRVHWHRIILDECTNIKNHESMAARACSLLIADHRWLLSGTPLTNGPEELYSYLLFLRMQVASGSFEHFYNNFIETRTAMERMQQLIGAIMLRRRIDDRFQGRKIVKLPACGIHTIQHEPTRLEQVIIDICEERLRYHVNEIIKRHQQERSDPRKKCLAQRNRNILVLMLRMRQILCHPLLAAETIQKLLTEDDCQEIRQVQRDSNNHTDNDYQAVTDFRKLFAEAEAKMRRGSVDEARIRAASVPNGSAFGKSQISGEAFLEVIENISQANEDYAEQMCVRCNKIPSGAVTGTSRYRTDCNHLYCLKCLEEYTQEYRRQNPAAVRVRCFRCDHIFRREEVKEEWESPMERELRLLKTRENQDTSWIGAAELMPSTKMMAVKALISGWLQDDSSTKVIVFVQFRTAIKCLERICRDESWNALPYHGGMTLKAREKSLKDFKERRSQNILLATQPSGGIGLNLTCATKIISLDLWWNYAAEQQAFCRIFRIGQTKKTTVVRIAIKSSFDTRMLEIQERKMAGINKAMNDDGTMLENLDTDDLLSLFGSVDKHQKGYIVPKKPETDPYRGGHRYEPFNFGYYEEQEVEEADDSDRGEDNDQDDSQQQQNVAPQQQQQQQQQQEKQEQQSGTQQDVIIIEDDGGEVEDSSDE